MRASRGWAARAEGCLAQAGRRTSREDLGLGLITSQLTQAAIWFLLAEKESHVSIAVQCWMSSFRREVSYFHHLPRTAGCPLITD